MPRIEGMLVGDYKVTIITSGRLVQNCYLVKHIPSGDILVIDPGGGVQQVISEIDNEGGQLRLILLTHGHYDHVAGVKQVCEKYGLPFYIHQADVKLLKRAPMYAISMEKRIIEVSSNYQFLEERISEWNGDSISVINAPGHTPGSVCFYFGNMVFTGDIILTEHEASPGLPGYDHSELAASVSRILNELPGDTIFFPGHGKSDTINNIRNDWKNNKLKLKINKA
jgi:hydroxyacylglutathione hydrolase